MSLDKLQSFVYGGDYNPEQWTKEYWEEDIRLMQKAGVNMVSVGIFSWARLQRDEDTFDFSWMDTILDMLHEGGIKVDLATATASVPPWAYERYEDIYPEDESKNRLWYGSRQSYCPNSPSYRMLTSKLVRTIAQRYKDHKALAMWHVNNEYSCHVAACYCDTCARAFREWLKKRYGTIEEVNRSWGTSFWSQWYYSFDQIMPPRKTTAQHNPGQVLDYKRFMSDSLLECYLTERRILREITPEVPVTTNFMLEWKPLDYVKWAKELDVISWDSYPNPSKGTHPANNAFDHDLMRSLAGDKPFMLLEQAPSQVNWRPVNTAKYPGLNRLYSLQCIARGGEGVMYFQWRQSLRGSEKFHSACITHTGDENSRVFQEVARIGNELQLMKAVSGSRPAAKVGILFDYDNWWAVEYEPGPSNEVRYRQTVLEYYTICYEHNVPIDFLFHDSDLSEYSLIIAPLLHMVKPHTAERIDRFVSSGGVFLTSFFSGIVDQEDAVFEGGYPGPLRKILGIQVEEFNPLESHMENGLQVVEGNEVTTYGSDLWCDLIRLEGAERYAVYTQDYLQSEAAVTVNSYGKGRAWYVGTRPEKSFLEDLLGRIFSQTGIEPLLKVPVGVEVTRREVEGQRWLFILNFNREAVVVDLGGYSGRDLLSGTSHSGILTIPATDWIGIELD